MRRTLLSLMLLAFAAGAARAAEGIEWDDNRPEFKLFLEKKHYTRDTWAELAPADQNDALKTVEKTALQRQKDVEALYAQAAAGKWDAPQAKYFTDRYDGAELKAVYIWIGGTEGHALMNKVSAVREAISKAAAGIDEAEAVRLQPYLQPKTISDLRSAKFVAEQMKQKAAAKPKPTVSQSGDKLGKLGPKLDEAKLGGLYDNSKGGKGGADSGAVAADLSGLKNGKVPLSTTQNATAAKTIKAAAPAAIDTGDKKSKAWTSDAYGITIETPQGKQSFRDSKAAEAAIKAMPPGSINKITLYGHGSPGMQTVGPATYEAEDTALLLKGKMAKNGVVQFSGCNTSSIGDSTLNPAVGLSMVARRLLYFSLPYFQDRADGIPAAQAKQQWDKGWNADLARDTSAGIKGAIVCGYRTFGLVPGRLPGLTKLMGNQEATEPGVVAGKKACYQDGKEVPVP
ncbi:MAG: hypothetical protein HY952_09245 [Elusimicrobia bacterium]|nr:hypothetical protein [Elusimicrobiota bacterium]